MNMINKLLVIILLTAFINQLVAQDNRKENGVKVGHWEHKDSRDKIYAEGNYNDGVKEGKWLYFVSSISRQTHVPDVKGEYNSAGQKTGTWTFISTGAPSQNRIQIDANFSNGLMDGACTYYSSKGNILATGFMNTGIRHGQWVFFYDGKKMTDGFYQNGLKIGDWTYDYYPDPTMHIKGLLNFDDGNKNGKLEYYRVDHHPKFGTEELLSGIGTFSNGKKMGRWIEYSPDLVEKRDKDAPKGEKIETGNYNRNGKRQGYWKTTIDRKNYTAAIYDNGLLHGKFMQYHSNGKLKYETMYEKGITAGTFIRYYNNGNIEEEGTTTSSVTPSEGTKKTVYYTLELPCEYYFQLVELSNFHLMKHHYATWILNPNYSVEPAELDRRFEAYKDYALEPEKRIQPTNTREKKAVRTGEYKAYFRNQKLKLKGSYYPKMKEVFFPETRTYMIDYARDGEWKEYDDNGYNIKTIVYDKGTFIKMFDGKGNEMGIDTPKKAPSELEPKKAPSELETKKAPSELEPKKAPSELNTEKKELLPK
jgi:antitoxin component YwqK of YwqJK toxin-antitoxin module